LDVNLHYTIKQIYVMKSITTDTNKKSAKSAIIDLCATLEGSAPYEEGSHEAEITGEIDGYFLAITATVTNHPSSSRFIGWDCEPEFEGGERHVSVDSIIIYDEDDKELDLTAQQIRTITLSTVNHLAI